ncbi:MAG: eL32 family ribosomal protein [Candidatus Micrarchaeia archaeon]
MLAKKKHPKFNVPNFGAKSRSRVKARWRKQRGDDNKKRIKKPFMGAEPNIGYKNPESIRHTRNGRFYARIENMAQLQELISKKASVDIILASTLSKYKKAKLTEEASKNGFKVVNKVRL